jgi:hypothetical protein
METPLKLDAAIRTSDHPRCSNRRKKKKLFFFLSRVHTSKEELPMGGIHARAREVIFMSSSNVAKYSKNESA